jgi:hypothetical protein
MLEAAALGAGALVAAGFPVATMARAAQSAADLRPSAMLAASVVLRPEAGAEVQFAYLDTRGRPLRVLPAVRLEARRTTLCETASAWGQAQEAAALAQTLAAAMAATAWGAPASECEIRPGRIVHPATGKSIRHCVWVDVA